MPRQSVKDAIKDWLASWSLSQVKNIPRTKNIYWICFWLLTFLVTLGAGVWKGYGEVQKYLSYPFDTYKKFESLYNTPFPAVTICNLNPMSQENGNYIRQVKELMTVYRYHLSLLKNKETQNAAATENQPTESDGKRYKRFTDYEIVMLTLPGVDQGRCYTTTTQIFQTITSTTTLKQTEAQTTKEKTSETTKTTQRSNSPTTEIPLPKTTAKQTKISESTSIPSTTGPQSREPDTTSAQTASTVLPSETAGIQTNIHTASPTTQKYTDIVSSNPVTAASSTLEVQKSQSTKLTASTDYTATKTSFAENPTRQTASTSATVNFATEEPETSVPLTTKLNGATSKSEASTDYRTTKPYTLEVATTKQSLAEIQTTISEVNEIFTTKAVTPEVPPTVETTIKPTTKSSVPNTQTETPEAFSLESSTVFPTSEFENTKDRTIKSTVGKYSTTRPANLEATASHSSTSKPIEILTPTSAISQTPITTTTTERQTDEFLFSSLESSDSSAITANTIKSTKLTTTISSTSITPKSEQPELTSMEGKSSVFLTSTTTTTKFEDSKEDATKSTVYEYGTKKFEAVTPSSPSIKATKILTVQTSSTTLTKREPEQTIEHLSSSKESSGNSQESDTKQTESLPATASTMQSTKEANKSTAFSSTITTITSSQNTFQTTTNFGITSTTAVYTNSVPNEPSEATKTSPSSTMPDKLTSETESQKSSISTTSESNIELTKSTSSTISGEITSETENQKSSISTTPESNAEVTTKTVTSSHNTLPTTNNLGVTSTTTVYTNSMANDLTEASKISPPSTMPDKLTSETENQKSSFSTTPDSNAQLTTFDPIIFEGLTKTELVKLTEDYLIVPPSSRISLESQAQGRLLSLANNNLNASYAINDLIISCTYNMISCDLERDFAKISDPWFGNCYTFNYDAKHLIAGTGDRFGLKIIAFSNVTEYLPTSSKAGMKVVVHKQNFDPFPNNEGIYASVGSHVNVNVRYKSIEQLTAPYGVCRHENDTAGYIYDGRYRIEGCYRSCFQQRIIDECQCADPRFPKPRGLNISWCDVSNEAHFVCYITYLSTKGDFMHVKNCVCPHGCTEPDYTLDVSPSKWPINKKNYITPKCWGNFPNSKIDCFQAYKKNAAAIDVTYNRMFYRRAYEQASFSVMDLILEIAGNLGLWTGFSMLVLGEIFNIFFYILYRPNVDARIGDIEMSEMSNQNTSDIYDSPNTAEEYGNDVPRPINSHSLNAGLMQDLPSNDNDSFKMEDFDFKEPDSCRAFLLLKT